MTGTPTTAEKRDDGDVGRCRGSNRSGLRRSGGPVSRRRHARRPQTLTALSAAAFAAAKSHRYLVSCSRGFIEQSAADGRYDFGGAAL
jgi:hypothetical protein